MSQWVRIDFIIRGAGSVRRCRDDQVPTHDPAATVIHEDLCRYELHQDKDWLHGRPISELPWSPMSASSHNQ